MTDHIVAARNLGSKALRRLSAAHKPFVRLLRRGNRLQEQLGYRRDARRIEREIAAAAAGTTPIVAGPWLGEVGYEVLYWVPFLRWFQDAYRIPPGRLIAVSRGGVHDWYDGLAATYMEIFDRLPPADLSARNDARREQEEGGGRKQSGLGALDQDILAHVRAATGHDRLSVLHPSLMFRLFRHVWHGNLPFDLFWTRTRYALTSRPAPPPRAGLPPEFVAVKFYSGTALPATPENRDAVRRLVARAAERWPVIVLDTGLAVDDHADFTFADLPNVSSAREWMRPNDNLGIQSALVARARLFLGTCGGLAWHAPFLNTPAVAVYSDDRLLGPHLFVARQAGRRVGAADFLPLDLRALQHAGVAHLL